ncbi:unnamed protein product [Mytilus edulis]|uniref:Uncharacterized protein n=1 Tax=Mytilus edulis TaxID=6550 RepID=A0A8S3UH14_MYTED|nr:unnamed protein product [Mytilus edulis]
MSIRTNTYEYYMTTRKGSVLNVSNQAMFILTVLIICVIVAKRVVIWHVLVRNHAVISVSDIQPAVLVNLYDRPDTEPQDDLNAEDSNVENYNATNDEQMEEDEEVNNDDRDDVDDTLHLDDRDDATDVKENSDVNTAQDELNLDENPNTDSGNNTPDDDDEQTEVMTVHELSKDNLIDNEINILHKKGGSQKVNESVSHKSNVVVDSDLDKKYRVFDWQ